MLKVKFDCTFLRVVEVALRALFKDLSWRFTSSPTDVKLFKLELDFSQLFSACYLSAHAYIARGSVL